MAYDLNDLVMYTAWENGMYVDEWLMILYVLATRVTCALCNLCFRATRRRFVLPSRLQHLLEVGHDTLVLLSKFRGSDEIVAHKVIRMCNSIAILEFLTHI